MSAAPSELRIRRRVAVLGATGAVGQAFVRALADHPWFEIAAVAASERSAGKSYAEATRWLGPTPMPDAIASLTVQPCDPERVDTDLVFSALDASVAGDVEAAFARADRFVLSNAKNYRMEPDVPLVIAEVNPDHLALLSVQQKNRGWRGGIVTNGNCSAIVAATALAPFHRAFGLRQVFAMTMQAVSGAGYPGVPSLDILGNVVPFISGEEDKIENEIRKFLGDRTPTSIQQAEFTVSAQANRVPVEHGHTINLAVSLARNASIDEIIEAVRAWKPEEIVRGLPSAPAEPIHLSSEPDGPQPRRDVNRGNGMTVSIGRIRPDPIVDVKFVALGHNILRGAAGASVLNAELLVASGLLPGA